MWSKVEENPVDGAVSIRNAYERLQEKIREIELGRIESEEKNRILLQETSNLREKLAMSFRKTPDEIEESEKSEVLSSCRSVKYVVPMNVKYLENVEKRCAALERRIEILQNRVSTLPDQVDEDENSNNSSECWSSLSQSHLPLASVPPPPPRPHPPPPAHLHNSVGKSLSHTHHHHHHQHHAHHHKTSSIKPAKENHQRYPAERPLSDEKRKTQKKKDSSSFHIVDDEQVRNSVPVCRKYSSTTRSSPRLPFIVGQATTPSHNVAVNIQSVMRILNAFDTQPHRRFDSSSQPPPPQQQQNPTKQKSQKNRNSNENQQQQLQNRDSTNLCGWKSCEIQEVIEAIEKEIVELKIEFADLKCKKSKTSTGQGDNNNSYEKSLYRLQNIIKKKQGQVKKLKIFEESTLISSGLCDRPASSTASSSSSSFHNNSQSEIVSLSPPSPLLLSPKSSAVHLPRTNGLRLLKNARHIQRGLRAENISWTT